MPESQIPEPSQTITKTKIRTNTLVGWALVGSAIIAAAAGGFSATKLKRVCDSGPKQGQRCMRDQQCRTGGNFQARCKPDMPITAVVQATSLTVELAGDTPQSRILVGGHQDESVLKVKFTAQSSAVRIQKVRIAIDDPNDGNGILAVDLRYPRQDGTQGTASGALIQGIADFSGLDMHVAQDSMAVLEVLVDLAAIDADGISGDTPRFRFVKNENFEAVLLSSSLSLTAIGTGYVEGLEMVIRKTKPTINLHATSPSGATVPTGNSEVMRFTVSADPSGDVILEAITFRTNISDNGNSGWNINGDASGNIDTVGGWSLYDATDISTALDERDGDYTDEWTLYGAGASDGTLSGTEAVGFARLVLEQPVTISAGTYKVFSLKVDTVGASTASDPDDNINMMIVEDVGTTNTTVAALNELQWDETGSGSASNISGHLIDYLPVSGGTLVF